MCGITGYTGRSVALPFIMQGLEKLEYRGYDSAGVTLVDKSDLFTCKVSGRLDNLKAKLDEEAHQQTCGIGHTRWATHGVPSQLNSHPHTNSSGTISLVHNGIIENYLSLKQELLNKGYVFQSETDTEIIVHLLDDVYYHETGDMLQALLKVVNRLKGSFALCIVSKEFPDQIYVAKKESPMILGKNETGTFCASDAPALLAYGDQILPLKDKEVAILSPDDIRVFNFKGEEMKQEWIAAPYNIQAAQKGGYDSFMLKEIHEQPRAIRETLRGRIINDEIEINELNELDLDWKKTERIYFVACGTAYHAGISAAKELEKLTDVPVYAIPASEFRYGDPYLNGRCLCIFISQSGETADTIAAIKLAKQKQASTVGVVNVLGSSLTRLSDVCLYTCAGPEISVASTKAYTTQIVLLSCLIIKIAEKINGYKPDIQLIIDFKELPELVEKVLKHESQVKELSGLFKDKKDAYFIGRQHDYPVALEGSLKLKEVSYVHADAYYAGELKHGPIALIEDGTIVIALATQEKVAAKTISNIQETLARGSKVILITTESIEVDGFEYVIRLKEISRCLMPVQIIVLLQLLAYYVAVIKGCDIDKPRNLAKSVTVE
ncbi:MAG: glutamine--fructose-6-phosphate transaminase (isomerizing) [Erysipelotrichaceae bacterium]|nr:glutamine--fructose-6-phosphate transaminase (isomerizing) [Erysipelotrichaceae bacterium]